MGLMILTLCVISQNPPGDAGSAPPIVQGSYDRITGEAKLWSNLGRIGGNAADPLAMRIGRIPFPDQALTHVNVVFIYANTARRRADHPTLTFLCDGVRFQKKNLSHDIFKEDGHSVENFYLNIPVENLLAIANAKSAEGKLGSTEFKISARQQSAMREFLACLPDPAGAADRLNKAAAAAKAEAERIAAARLRESEKLLEEARALDRKSKMTEALVIYRKIVQLYPGTPAEGFANKRIAAIEKATR